MAGRKLSKEEKALVNDMVAGHQRLQQQAAERATHTNDPDELAFLEDIRNTSENIITRLIKLLLGLLAGGTVVALIYFL